MPRPLSDAGRASPPGVRRLVPIALALAGLCGCQKALFPTNQPRTQFELHDQMRGNAAQLEKPDAFGKPQADLRSRLSTPN